eukprot:4683954-Ditylum_brightwellii.AAC.1
MRYHIATTFGITAFVNYFNLFDPVFGIRQGATDGPPGWLFIDPTKQIAQGANSAMFVDDISHHYNDKNKAITSTQLMKCVQYGIELWGNIILATGGLLEFTKSIFFLLIWKFHPSGQLSIVQEPGLPKNNVRITNAHGNATILQKVSAGKGIKG